ncbi:hypothetical protein V6N13_052913 [Hibiscus sabdariffa]|uniref:Uncharacterized protein n=1 Tax=Hibiscus sabdariffa TaxID=183260 RepID=A0ABR2Q5Q0_9ROSI
MTTTLYTCQPQTSKLLKLILLPACLYHYPPPPPPPPNTEKKNDNHKRPKAVSSRRPLTEKEKQNFLLS